MHYPKQDKLDKPPFEGLDVSKKAFTFLQPLLHEWMSEWMNEKLITGRMEDVKKGKPNNHQFTLIKYVLTQKNAHSFDRRIYFGYKT